jgi:hypothetical protein
MTFKVVSPSPTRTLAKTQEHPLPSPQPTKTLYSCAKSSTEKEMYLMYLGCFFHLFSLPAFDHWRVNHWGPQRSPDHQLMYLKGICLFWKCKCGLPQKLTGKIWPTEQGRGFQYGALSFPPVIKITLLQPLNPTPGVPGKEPTIQQFRLIPGISTPDHSTPGLKDWRVIYKRTLCLWKGGSSAEGAWRRAGERDTGSYQWPPGPQEEKAGKGRLIPNFDLCQGIPARINLHFRWKRLTAWKGSLLLVCECAVIDREFWEEVLRKLRGSALCGCVDWEGDERKTNFNVRYSAAMHKPNAS